MQMLYHLSGSGTIIAKNIIAVGPYSLLDGSGQLRKKLSDFGQRFRLGLIDSLGMLFGNHQRMSFGRRIDIQKSDQPIIFKELCARNLP
jgi:hypothetical protein